jgi:hypothetical protein
MGARSCQGPKVLAVQRALEAIMAIEAAVLLEGVSCLSDCYVLAQ